VRIPDLSLYSVEEGRGQKSAYGGRGESVLGVAVNPSNNVST
jgi:hypothetical protein